MVEYIKRAIEKSEEDISSQAGSVAIPYRAAFWPLSMQHDHRPYSVGGWWLDHQIVQ